MILEPIVKVFSLTKSKSNTVFKSIIETKSFTTSKVVPVWTVVTPTSSSFLIIKSLNFLNPAVWFKVDTGSFHLSYSHSDFNEYEKYW